MRIEGVPFSTIEWDKIALTEHAGETGKAIWRTVEQGNLRVRKVEYTAGYKANHWCSRGHVLHVMWGELKTELQDGRAFTLRAGDTYIVADGAEPHRSQTAGGAKLFIVD
jgi:quercetin dioxygenase-like cupin family protein